GTLVGVGDTNTTHRSGIRNSFSSQLFFSKMTDAGDSGAVIIRESDNTVTGLNFAGNETDTVANPLFKNNWHKIGSVRFEGGSDIPMFDDTISSSSVRTTDLRNFDLNRQAASKLSFRDLPNLDAGRLFLGEA